MDSIVDVDPFRCRMWGMHDRLEDYVSEDTCRAELDSFDRHGQLVPVLGRPVVDDPAFSVELIYGARRLFVARHLNRKLRVTLRNISDVDAIIAMDVENRLRKDLSPYERALSYARFLRSGHFRTQDDLAKVLSISASQISRLLKLTKLPSVVLAAFSTPLDICESWGQPLCEAWDDQDRRKSISRIARDIASQSPRPSPIAIFERLISGSSPRRHLPGRSREEVIVDALGRPLLRIRRLRTSVALVVPLAALSQGRLSSLKRAFTDILAAPVGSGEQNGVSSGNSRDLAIP